MNAGLQDCSVLFLFLSTRIIFFLVVHCVTVKVSTLSKKVLNARPVLHLILQLLHSRNFWFVFSFLLYFFINLLVIMQHTCLGVAYECDFI